MNELAQVIPELIDHPATMPALIILGLLIVIYLNKTRIRQGWLKFKTRYCLNHLGLEQLSNLKCPDGLDHYFTIDRLLLRDDRITLLVYKQYPGKIFCADQIDEWTQMLGQKSYKFKNPLFELDYQIKAISACIPNVEVDGYLFFDHQAEFPKGHPERVIYPDSIPDKLKKHNRHQLSSSVMEAWKKLQDLTVQ